MSRGGRKMSESRMGERAVVVGYIPSRTILPFSLVLICHRVDIIYIEEEKKKVYINIYINVIHYIKSSPPPPRIVPTFYFVIAMILSGRSLVAVCCVSNAFSLRTNIILHVCGADEI